MSSAGGNQPQAHATTAARSYSHALFPLLLVTAVLILYGSSLHFGLIWDDPAWYRQGMGMPVWQIFAGLSSYQFYRPLDILLNRLLVSSTGVVNATLAHAIQVGVHLAVVLSSVPVLRAFKFSPWHARLTALIFAVFPWSYQAVAWQVPQQPFAMLFVLWAAWAAHRFVSSQRIGMLALSAAAYAAALLFHENALPFVFVFFWLATQGPRLNWPWRAWPLVHLAIAGAYCAVWLSVPRLPGVTGSGFQVTVLAYLLQSVAFVPAHLAAGWLSGWPAMGLVAAFALFGLALAVAAWKCQGPGPALFSCLWIGAGLLPPWAGLSWEYVQYSPRLAYPAALGIAALWGALAALAMTAARPWWRALGWAILVLVVGVSLRQWFQFRALYQSGTAQLAAAVRVLAQTPQDHVLFVNFPDSVDLRPPPYPLGVWGLPLAPVVQDVSDYARAQMGTSAQDHSRSAFWVGWAERSDWPYHVAMRGSGSEPAALLQQASWADEVYLSDYEPGGLLRLRAVGHVLPHFSATPALARIGEAVELGSAELSGETGLTLTWRVRQTLSDSDAIFVHYWKDGDFIASQDSDSLAGLIPLGAWQPGTEVVDIRPVIAEELGPGRYQVRTGLYNRQDGVRYPAYALDDARYPDDEVPVGTIVVP